jgi:alkanesulfonate monooxygenase SsuD/methylene tetrahydromethanopterin reductase-like flavin-dependent oxidoreductase (luciferase family)
MGRVDFGWVIPPGVEVAQRATYVATVEQGLRLVAGRFDGAWAVDHLQEAGEQDMLEGWTTLAYFAAAHPTLRLGHAVLCQAFRNPALLAKMAATLQFLSGGRLVLGIGTGWHEPEHRAYGYDFPAAGARITQLEEALAIIKALWTAPLATVAGRYYAVTDAYCEPRPNPVPPIMIGGARPRMMRLIARHADWWCVGWTGLARYREQAAEMERACAEVGRDPATLRRVWFGPCACAPTRDAALAFTDERFTPERGFVGTPAQLIEQLQAFVELGVDYFQFGCVDFPQLTSLELLAHEVLPALNA